MPIMKTMLIVMINTVIWCPRLHKPLRLWRWDPPMPLTTVKCVELAMDNESRSLVLYGIDSMPSQIGIMELSLRPFLNSCVSMSILFWARVMFFVYAELRLVRSWWGVIRWSSMLLLVTHDWDLCIFAKFSTFATVSRREPDEAL